MPEYVSARELTRKIEAALAKRFQPPEWAAFFEVCAPQGRRRCDLFAFNTFPSRGLAIHGIEIKASRSDFLKELREPDKAEEFARYCDRWWIAAPKGIAKKEEMPQNWGLLELAGKTLRQKKAAPQLKPVPIPRDQLAMIMRGAHNRNEKELARRVKEAIAPSQEKLDARIKREVETRTYQHSRLLENVAAFEKSSGLKLDEWSGGRELGEAVKMVTEMGISGSWGGIGALAREAGRLHERFQKLANAAGISKEEE